MPIEFLLSVKWLKKRFQFNFDVQLRTYTKLFFYLLCKSHIEENTNNVNLDDSFDELFDNDVNSKKISIFDKIKQKKTISRLNKRKKTSFITKRNRNFTFFLHFYAPAFRPYSSD